MAASFPENVKSFPTHVDGQGNIIYAQYVNDIQNEISAMQTQLQRTLLLGYYANTETLTGDKTLTDADDPVQVLDPGGANRDVNLPAEADTNHVFVISNTADADETLTVKDDGGGGTEIDTVSQDETKLFVSDGTRWVALSGGGSSGGASTDGWNSDSNTWTYSSVDDPTGVITVDGVDATDYLSVGMRIKMTNGGNTIYGIITKISYSSPNTTVTFLHEIDPTDSQALHLLVDSAITNPYYSSSKAPHGFHLERSKWSVVVTDTTERTKASPAQNTWYYSDMGSIDINVPIGAWELSYDVYMQVVETSGTIGIVYSTLSTSNSSESDSQWRGTCGITAPTGTLASRQTVHKAFDVEVSSKTTYYLLASTPNSAVDTIYFSNDVVDCVLKAVCAYL